MPNSIYKNMVRVDDISREMSTDISSNGYTVRKRRIIQETKKEVAELKTERENLMVSLDISQDWNFSFIFPLRDILASSLFQPSLNRCFGKFGMFVSLLQAPNEATSHQYDFIALTQLSLRSSIDLTWISYRGYHIP